MGRDNTIARLENIAKHAVHTAGEDIFILNLDDGLAIHEAIEALKAQLTHEGTTSDLISKTEVVKHLRRMLESTAPNTDYDEGYIDGIEFGISTVSTMPTVQSEPCGDKSYTLWKESYEELKRRMDELTSCSDLISRQAAIDALDVLCQEHRYRIPGKRETYSEYNEAWQDALDRAEGLIFNLPPAQPEPHEGHWILYDKRFPWRTWYKCSECGNYLDFAGVNGGRAEPHFCPNCGAKMTISR